MEYHIQVRDLVFSYQWKAFRKQIFQNLDLRIERGSFVTVIGGNGCGKSSLIKLILGLLRPDQGSIVVDGARVRPGYPEGVRSGLIAYLAQQIEELFLTSTVGEELHSDRHVSAETSIYYLKKLGLQHILDRSIEDLSGGERQSLALANFMGKQAQLLILDEPSSYLDNWRTKLLKEYLIESHEAGKTILHITQYESEIQWGTHLLDLQADHPEVVFL